MKILSISILLLANLLSATIVSAQQNWLPINNSTKIETEIKLVSSGENETLLKFKLNAYQLKQVQTEQGISSIVSAPDAARILKAGAPDLPCYAKSIIINDMDEMAVDVVNSQYIEINNIEIAPSKGNLLRNVDPSSVPYTLGAEYQQNSFYPANVSFLREPYILRDYRGQTVVIQPFAYNPVSKVLRIYTDLTLKVFSTGIAGINTFTRTKALKSVDTEYNQIYGRQFLNYKNGSKYTPVSDLPGKMLIISDPSFMPTVQPLVDWKILEGMPCEMVSVAIIGNNVTAIKNYVSNYYTTNGLTFLLLVGDFAQVTSPTANIGGTVGAKDIEYAFISGNDHYPEFFVGRFSAETVADAQTQVQRSIYYEKTPQAGTWYSKNLGIASDQGPGDDNEYDYDHIRPIQTDLLGFTYDTSVELFDGSQGGLDASGNPTAANVTSAVNPGMGIITYCGHGADNAWGTTGFSSTNATALLNVNKLPFIYSVSCVIGHYNTGTCFCEAWMRAKQNEGPTGAIGIFGSTINQSWNPPMEAQDEMIDILTESYSNNIKRTYAGIGFNGCMLMNDTYADFDMTDTWTIFGDPSLMVRTQNPMTMTVSHPPTLVVGLNAIQVNCNVEGAYVSITYNNQILGTGYVNGGSANITLDPAPTTVTQVINVCVTAFNYIPYIGTFEVASSGAPYIVYDSKVVHDSGIAANGIVEYSENVSLDLTLKNVGAIDATNISATLSTTNSVITITDNTQSYGTIPANSPVNQANAFAFSVANVVTDQQSVPFVITSTDGGTNTWQTNFSVLLNAPVMSATTVTVDDATLGNGNGRLDPGEIATVKILTSNTGHAVSPIANSTLTVNSGMVTVPVNTASLGTINVGNNVLASFDVQVDAGAVIGSDADFTFDVNANGYTASKTFSFKIGLAVEDFESSTFTQFPWNNSGSYPWIIINNGNVFEGNYTAVSGNFHIPSSNSDLIMPINVISGDSMSFYKKVSSEANFDYLKFYVDGVLKNQWSGEVNWSRNAYFITSGTHTLKWTYSKDSYLDVGQDAAWVDFIVFPPISLSTDISESLNGIQYLAVFPNPVSTESVISFSLKNSTDVNLSIVNSLGQTVKVLLDDRSMSEGVHVVSLSDLELSAGVYFCKLTSEGTTLTVKFISQ